MTSSREAHARGPLPLIELICSDFVTLTLCAPSSSCLLTASEVYQRAVLMMDKLRDLVLFWCKERADEVPKPKPGFTDGLKVLIERANTKGKAVAALQQAIVEGERDPRGG